MIKFLKTIVCPICNQEKVSLDHKDQTKMKCYNCNTVGNWRYFTNDPEPIEQEIIKNDEIEEELFD